LLREQVSRELHIDWDEADGPAGRYGTVYLLDGEFLTRGQKDLVESAEVRQQPFALLLRKSAHGDVTLLHGVSPVGQVDLNDKAAREMLEIQSAIDGDKICAVPHDDSESYSLTVEGDLLLDPDLTQAEELSHLIRRICLCADYLEQYWRGEEDISIDQFRRDLHKEAKRASH